MTTNNKITGRHYLTLAIILGLEIVLCGIQQLALSEPYSIYYAVVTVVFIAFQTVYCLNLNMFVNGKSGIRDFFIYKAIKLLSIILPLFIYVIVTDKVDAWILIRIAAYYFTFLVVETAITSRHLKENKIQTATADK